MISFDWVPWLLSLGKAERTDGPAPVSSRFFDGVPSNCFPVRLVLSHRPSAQKGDSGTYVLPLASMNSVQLDSVQHGTSRFSKSSASRWARSAVQRALTCG